jgi:cytochrome P450
MALPNHAPTAAFTARDLYAPDVFANPYPYYDLLRDQPIQYGLEDFPPGTVPGQDKPIPAWVILKHADVVNVCSNHAVFSSRDRMQEASSAPTLMLVNHDEPRHGVLRGIAQKAFTPKRVVTDVSPWMVERVDQMLEAEGDGEVDFMANLAPDLPARFMTKLLGTPETDYKRLRRWANAFMVTSEFTLAERNQCNAELFAYYTDAVADRYDALRRGVPLSDDLMTAFIQAESEGNKLTREEVVLFCITLVVAGAETTGYLLGNLVAALVERPDLFAALRADRTLVRPFIEESLRRDGPIQRLHRECTQDTEIGGITIRAGDWVAVFFASANRDPAVWDRPDDFVLQRPNVSKQMTFSHGIHRCMGAGIARNEAEKMLNGILDRYVAIEPGKTPMVRQRGGLLNYGHEHCPVRFVSA